MKQFSSESIDLIFTSPPYDTRRSYGGVDASNYNEWLKPILAEFQRILKPTGNLLFNIGNKWQNWKSHTYVYDIPSLAESCRLRFIHDIIWKQGSGFALPIKMIDEYEHIYWFNTTEGQPTFYPDSLRHPYKKSSIQRYKADFRNCRFVEDRLLGKWNGDYVHREPNPLGALPFNIIEMSAETENPYQHPAVFPMHLARYIISGWSKAGDVVLDPFVGSGTTIASAKELHRKWIGIDIKPEYCEMSQRRINDTVVSRRLVDSYKNSLVDIYSES